MKAYQGFLTAAMAAMALTLGAGTVGVLPHPANQDVVRENGRISIPASTRNKVLALVPEGGFTEGYEYTFGIRLADSRFAFVTGRTYVPPQSAILGKTEPRQTEEAMRFTPLADTRVTRTKDPYCVRVIESSPHVMSWQSNASSMALDYYMPDQTFATIDNVARWQEREALTLRHDLSKEDIRLGVAVTESHFRFFINGVFLRQLPRDGIDLGACTLRIEEGTVAADKVEVRPLDGRYMTLDISERLNAAGLPGFGTATNLIAGSEVDVGGVPFLLPRRQKFDHLDLASSWMAAAMRCSYEATEVWSRWKAATDKTPLRYQFRVPSDAYDTLYVLAASDGRTDTIPRFTAQFYLPSRGRPVNFASPDIPSFQSEAEVADSITLLSANGKEARLYLVKVPLEPGQFTKFSASAFFDMELTKDVQTYRAYPDPLTHSIHGAGLPSSVRVFGITLGRSHLRTVFSPDTFANIWHEGERAGYTARLDNTTPSTISASLSFRAESYDGSDVYEDGATARVGAGETRKVAFRFKPRKFGYYTVTLTKRHKGVDQTFSRTMVHLRKREYGARSFDHKGMFFGCWHVGSVNTVRLAGMLGMDGFSGLNIANEEAMKWAQHYGMQDFNGANVIRIGGSLAGNRNEKEDLAILREKMPPLFTKPGPVKNPKYGAILCEPGGVGTGHAGFGEYFGEEPYDFSKLTGNAADRYANYKYQFLTIRKVFKELAPNLKVMMPNGSWTFTIPFLQDPDTRKLMDGVKCDFQFYTRLPEQQMHQCSIHSLYYFHEAWKKYRPGETPLLVFGEGPDISPVYPGASTEELSAAHRIRCSVMLAGYGANHQHSWATSIDQSGGENHCSGGYVDNEVALNPELSYAAFATHTRHMRNAIFESFTNPGSFSAYCANFRNHQSGDLVRIIWSIRGTREFMFSAAPGDLTVYDAMDNVIPAVQRGSVSVVTVGPMPVYVYGTDGQTAITLGACDHSDSQPGALAVRLGNAAELFKQQTDDADELYVDMMPEYIRRFPARMKTATVETEENYGGQALSVSLPQQETDRGLMPYFTCLKPDKPIPIKGKASHILAWVKGASDWGRIVYVMRDAKGKLWYSVGFKGQWNGDDMPGDSIFCYDGWRLLRYELPANAPWDSFRELGFTNWGSENEMSLVELPLSLEKIFIERRSSVMYGNDRHAIPEEQPVLLGDILVEYAREADMIDEVIRLSRITAPELSSGSLPNPIEEMKKSGTLPAGRITGVKDPDTWFDGTRGVFSFEMPTNAVTADIWMSLLPDGKGALRQGSNLKASPAQVSGFLAGTEFHAFLVYKDKAGNTSVPSAAFKFKLEDHFAHQ